VAGGHDDPWTSTTRSPARTACSTKSSDLLPEWSDNEWVLLEQEQFSSCGCSTGLGPPDALPDLLAQTLTR
jgi:hypothetical protein